MAAKYRQLVETAMDDRSLLQAVLERDELAWKELMRRFGKLIFHCIGVVVKNRGGAGLSQEETDDVFSEVCVNLLRNDMAKLRRYDPGRGTKLGTWIGMIAVHTCCDYLRSARKRHLERCQNVEGQDRRQDEGRGPLDLLLEKERREKLASLVTGLTAREQCFFELYFTRGMEPPEVAREMNITVGSVYAQKHKLRGRLVSAAAVGALAA